jgi:hypothetical protein
LITKSLLPILFFIFAIWCRGAFKQAEIDFLTLHVKKAAKKKPSAKVRNVSLSKVPASQQRKTLVDFPDNNIRKLLKDAVDHVDDLIHDFLQGSKYEGLRTSDGLVLVNVNRGFNTAPAIARELGISRQAVHMSTQRLRARKLLTLKQIAPNSAELRLVMTPAGVDALNVGSDYLGQLEVEIAREIGAEAVVNLKRHLEFIARKLGQPRRS